MKKYNYGVAVVLIVAGLAMMYLARNFPYGGLEDIGAGFFPKILGGLLVLLSILLIVETAVRPAAEVTIDFHSPGMIRVLWMCAIMVVFCIIMKFLGFMIAMLFMIPACSFLIGERKTWKLAVTTLATFIFVYLVFEQVLHTGLPSISVI